jgi:hypothetical protein
LRSTAVELFYIWSLSGRKNRKKYQNTALFRNVKL